MWFSPSLNNGVVRFPFNNGLRLYIFVSKWSCVCVFMHTCMPFGLLNVYPIFDSQSEHVSAIWPWEWNREMEADRLWKKTVWFLHRKSNHQSIWASPKMNVHSCPVIVLDWGVHIHWYFRVFGIVYFTDFSFIFAVLRLLVDFFFFFFFLGKNFEEWLTFQTSSIHPSEKRAGEMWGWQNYGI